MHCKPFFVTPNTSQTAIAPKLNACEVLHKYNLTNTCVVLICRRCTKAAFHKTHIMQTTQYVELVQQGDNYTDSTVHAVVHNLVPQRNEQQELVVSAQQRDRDCGWGKVYLPSRKGPVLNDVLCHFPTNTLFVTLQDAQLL